MQVFFGNFLIMAILNILQYPDSRLRIKAKPIELFDKPLKETIADMFETMYASKGIGLAATQVNIHKRLIVLDVSPERDRQLVLLNPTVLKTSEEKKLHDEGCLSVPGFYESVERPDKILVEYFNSDGSKHQLEAGGLLSVCIQHEMDHLNGKVFVDYLSRLKQHRIQKKLIKEKAKLSVIN